MIEVIKDVKLNTYTTFKIGGPAEYFVVVKNTDKVKEALQFAQDKKMPVHVLGGGSNLLVSDEGVKGLVIKNEIMGLTLTEKDGEDVIVSVGAGFNWDELVKVTTEKGLWGLENLSGIPGTVGGAIVQNINAYGVTIADMVTEVMAINKHTRELVAFDPECCQFKYRDSFFKHDGLGKDYIVTEVKLRLSRSPLAQTTYRSSSQSIANNLRQKNITNPTPTDIREAVLFVRGRIGMLEGMYQGAGSFFKNPILDRAVFDQVINKVNANHAEKSAQFAPWHWSVEDDKEKISAAFLMECTQFNKTSFSKESYNGTVSISPLHTLSVINLGRATAVDVRSFVEKISNTIEKEFGIKLESEVCFL